jgi:hypothetical protein
LSCGPAGPGAPLTGPAFPGSTIRFRRVLFLPGGEAAGRRCDPAVAAAVPVSETCRDRLGADGVPTTPRSPFYVPGRVQAAAGTLKTAAREGRTTVLARLGVCQPPTSKAHHGGWLEAGPRILPPSPGGEATLFKIAAHCDIGAQHLRYSTVARTVAAIELQLKLPGVVVP